MTCVLFAPAIPEVETSRINQVGTDLSLSFFVVVKAHGEFLHYYLAPWLLYGRQTCLWILQ